MVVYVVVTSFPLFGEISILEIPVVGNFSLFARLHLIFIFEYLLTKSEKYTK